MHPFNDFLKTFVPDIQSKTRQCHLAFWLLNTTGLADAADLRAKLETELSLLYQNEKVYKQLLQWDLDPSLKDPLLKRELNVLIRSFKENAIPRDLLAEIHDLESQLLLSYTNFRAPFEGKSLSENELREVLKRENNPERRKKAWEATKLIGENLSDKLLSLVKMRNRAAEHLGYPNFFEMRLQLQEVDGDWLFKLLEEIAHQSENAYQRTLNEITEKLSKRFNVSVNELGPWAWSEPFCQDDPLNSSELDALVKNQDLCQLSIAFFQRMGMDVTEVLKRSDLFERPGKNQHAFCINMDRGKDIRTLNNIQPTLRWFETVLHELGHAIYEMGLDPGLPWLLRQYPHVISTEAMALIAGRSAYRHNTLIKFVTEKESVLIPDAEMGLKHRQLIFSRWVLVMSFFERELYLNPNQDLNTLWWSFVEKFQKIHPPENRKGRSDWAAKYHLALAPVYYYSYLLGELFASAIEEELEKITGSKDLESVEAGKFLQEKLFFPGNRMPWSDLVHSVVGTPLNGNAWLARFAL